MPARRVVSATSQPSVQESEFKHTMNIVLPPSKDEAIKHYALSEILPGLFALHQRRGILVYVLPTDIMPVKQVIFFTPAEVTLLTPLLEQYPDYCPYEVMMASFNSGNTQEATIEAWRQRLYEAKDAGIFDIEMKALRNLLSRARVKLFDFGLDVLTLYETGYVLTGKTRNHKRRE